MEEKEIMTNEEVIVETEVGTNESSGISAGMGFIIGAVTVGAIIAAKKAVTKIMANRKAKKELAEVVYSDDDTLDCDGDESEE